MAEIKHNKVAVIDTNEKLLDLDQLVATILSSLENDKAENIVSLDLVGKSSIADLLIVASGNSARLVSAMTKHLVEKLKSAGLQPRIEGVPQCNWVLVDIGDIIIHLFQPEIRAHYNIEKIWSIAPSELLENDQLTGATA